MTVVHFQCAARWTPENKHVSSTTVGVARHSHEEFDSPGSGPMESRLDEWKVLLYRQAIWKTWPSR